MGNNQTLDSLGFTNEGGNVLYCDSEWIDVNQNKLIINAISIRIKFSSIANFMDINKLKGKTNGKIILIPTDKTITYFLDIIHNILNPVGLVEIHDFVVSGAIS